MITHGNRAAGGDLDQKVSGIRIYCFSWKFGFQETETPLSYLRKKYVYYKDTFEAVLNYQLSYDFHDHIGLFIQAFPIYYLSTSFSFLPHGCVCLVVISAFS